MHETIRWPGSGSMAIDNNTAQLLYSNVVYDSWSQPPYYTTRIVNIIFMPAQAVRILNCRMLITTRTGTTTNPCQFTLCIIDANTGVIINQLPTTPPVLDPMNTSLFQLMTWLTVYQAIPASSAPIVNTGEYFGVVYTGTAGTQTASNNLVVKPLIEVFVEY